MKRFSSFAAVLYRRGKLLALMNAAFFGCICVVMIAEGLLLPPPLYEAPNQGFPEVGSGLGLATTFFAIFFSNLFLSSLVFVTLPGFVVFPLSTGLLLYRAVLWGLLLRLQPTWMFLAVIPTIVLEGEAYVLAAVAGTVVGASWMKPTWVYDEEHIDRIDALVKTLGECMRIYALVALLLLAAATVEIAALVMVTT